MIPAVPEVRANGPIFYSLSGSRALPEPCRSTTAQAVSENQSKGVYHLRNMLLTGDP